MEHYYQNRRPQAVFCTSVNLHLSVQIVPLPYSQNFYSPTWRKCWVRVCLYLNCEAEKNQVPERKREAVCERWSSWGLSRNPNGTYASVLVSSVVNLRATVWSRLDANWLSLYTKSISAQQLSQQTPAVCANSYIWVYFYVHCVKPVLPEDSNERIKNQQALME